MLRLGARARRPLCRANAARQLSSKLNLLIVECYDAAGRGRLASVGLPPASTTFQAVLGEVKPEGYEIEATVIHPADSVANLARTQELALFDGVIWTGSSLTIYHDVPEVRRQIELARRCYAAGLPQYGSCWGLQISATAAGIKCEPSPNGREQGIARGVTLTPAGLRHPMYDLTYPRYA